MKHLNADQQAQIRSALEATYGRRLRPERRSAPRVEHRALLALYPWPAAGAVPSMALVQDFSSNGIGIVHSQPLAAGAQHCFRLQRDGGRSLLVICTVARCEVMDDGLFCIGLQFLSVAPDSSASSAALNSSELPLRSAK